MTFIITLISLIIERFFHWSQLRSWNWFNQYQRRMTDRVSNWPPYAILIAIILPPVLIVGLIDFVLTGYFYGVFKIIFGVLVLLYCMGPHNLWLQAYGSLNSLSGEDPSAAIEHAKKTFNITLPANSQAFHQAVTSAIFIEANQRIFAVIFWFVILGPIGAVAYRAISLCATKGELSVSASAMQVQRVLDWLPIRLLTFIFALGGHFTEVIHCWKKEAAHSPNLNDTMLVECGIAALDVRNDDLLPENGEAEKEALALLDRSFIIVLVILAITVIMLR